MWGTIYDIPPSFWAKCKKRETQIVLAESIAVTMFIRDGLTPFREYAVTAFIDNLASLRGLVIGYSKSVARIHPTFT